MRKLLSPSWGSTRSLLAAVLIGSAAVLECGSAPPSTAAVCSRTGDTCEEPGRNQQLSEPCRLLGVAAKLAVPEVSVDTFKIENPPPNLTQQLVLPDFNNAHAG